MHAAKVWLGEAVLGANHGLLFTASVMMGVGAVKKDARTMILIGTAGLLAGACAVALAELVSMFSQYDMELSQINRDPEARAITREEVMEMKRKLPNPWQAAGVSALAFVAGAAVPFMAALFIHDYHLRLVAVVASVTVALIGFVWLSTVVAKLPMVKSLARVLVCDWVTMVITFGLTKMVGPSI